MHDLERAIARNDNRAVYRSRLLLDKDRAARGASLARIYDDLGFTEPARVIATGSLTSDPAGPPAHRFLSDIYARLPRHEVSRLSELLQWQLLKAPTLEAVQPRLQVSYLNIAPGTAGAEATFNEYTSLYERDRVRMLAAAFGGNQNTFGDEVLLTGSYRAFTLSLSQFHSDTDGFRRNADVQNDLYDAFAQVAVTPSLSVQAEYRSRDTDQGDINLNFDPRDFSSTERREIRQDTARFGARYRISQRSDLIASMIHGRRETTNTDIDRSTGIPFAQGNEDEGYQFEAQYLFRGEAFNLIAGGARYDIDDGDQTFEFGGFTVSDLDVSRDQSTAYVYSHFQWPRPVLWTAGLSYDYYEQKLDRKGFDLIDGLYPKLGVQWHIFDGLDLRAAYFGTAARAGVVDQTIEPTQVAGFNQWFDDFRGTEAERVGVGLDARFTDRWYAGIEASWRDLTVPNQIQLPVDPPQFTFQDEEWSEELIAAYVHWTPFDRWAAILQVNLDRFDLDRRIPDDRFRPGKVDTLSVPLRVRYFSPVGPFAELGVTFVRQDVELADPSSFPTDHDEFTLIDAAIGYRLPKRWGVLSLRVTNLFDEDFLYQDDNFRTFEERYARFIPERTVLARIVLDF